MWKMLLQQRRIQLLVIALLLSSYGLAQRTIINFEKNWKFINGNLKGAQEIVFNDNDWKTINVPHDWAIKGPFDKEIDKQTIAIVQNGETLATEKTGRTGALPHIGTGWYRRTFRLDSLNDDQHALLVFDGAMSDAHVFVNGKFVGRHPYGYGYFYFDISQYLNAGTNILAIQLKNKAFATRWYPGAGLYRKVQLIIKNKYGFEQWGTFVTTPYVTANLAEINIKANVLGKGMYLRTVVYDSEGIAVAELSTKQQFGKTMKQQLSLKNPKLWSPESPHLYRIKCSLTEEGKIIDQQEITMGVRKVEYEAGNGFMLNGETRKFKGVCLHHDLGPLGAAINKAALRRQLIILKDMGCDAIRSSHNMPSIEQLELCDELGFMFLAESFDEWVVPKVENGYNRWFNEWAEKDVVNLVRATRNHPCIVMWSSGNEVPDQWGHDGVKRAKWLQDIFHREDPTRPVTVGMDQVEAVMKSGFGAITDIPGLNYRVHLYDKAYECFPQGMILGSETASTISSRGVYKFPVEEAKMKVYNDMQCSSYDMEYCSWSNLPDDDFAIQEDRSWTIGQFVWTGFDYLGEPTPYDNYWPSRSSYFGICDLAGLPKDRYYLYRSQWNNNDETLHILPHWNWQGRDGQVTPIFVYTSYDRAELFINGKSQGIREKDTHSRLDRYRLRWMDVEYEPGTVKVVALNEEGEVLAEKVISTAGKPHKIQLKSDRNKIRADGKDLSFITVKVVDEAGNVCPDANNYLRFSVKGEGKFKAVCNGDATSTEMFHLPQMHLFNGQLVVLIESSNKPGDVELRVSGKGLISERIKIITE